MRKFIFIVAPLIFVFVACGDKITTMNTEYRTLYGVVSGSFVSLAGVPMAKGRYGVSCYTLDPEQDFVAEVTTRYNNTFGVPDNESLVFITKEVVEIQPINGTTGEGYVGVVNSGIDIGPIYPQGSHASAITIKGSSAVGIFQIPVIDPATNALTNNQYEVWVTTYVQESKGGKVTSPEGWFQTYWGLLFAAPKPGDDAESACIGLGGSGA